jgi:hypothetical protein
MRRHIAGADWFGADAQEIAVVGAIQSKERFAPSEHRACEKFDETQGR